MKRRNLLVFITALGAFLCFEFQISSQERKNSEVNWVEGYISAVGEGTSTPSGNRVKDQLRAVRAATILAQRALLETVKELKIDSQTKVQNKIVREDIIKTRVEGTIQGAEIFKQEIRWEGETLTATVHMRICLSGIGACRSEKSIVDALALSQKDEPAHAPRQRLNDIIAKQETIAQKVRDIIYDSSKPVTGIIFNLQGLFFERVILPVVITTDDENKPFTVYSVRSVDPPVIRTYGVVRYADSVEQAKQNHHLGKNVIVVPVSDVTKENMIIIDFGAARLIHETTSHGNDYLKSAKVIIAAK